MHPRHDSKKKSSRPEVTETREAVPAQKVHITPPEPLGLAPDAPSALRDFIIATTKDDLASLLRVSRKRVSLGWQEPKARQQYDTVHASSPAPPGALLPNTAFKIPAHLNSGEASAFIDSMMSARADLARVLWRKEVERIHLSQQTTRAEHNAIGAACITKLSAALSSDPVMAMYLGDFNPTHYVEVMYECTLSFAREESARKHIMSKIEAMRKAAAKEATPAAAAAKAPEALPDAKIAAAMRDIALKTAREVFKAAGTNDKEPAAASKPARRNKALDKRHTDTPAGETNSTARKQRKDTRSVRFRRGSSVRSTSTTRSSSPKVVLSAGKKGKQTGGRSGRR